MAGQSILVDSVAHTLRVGDWLTPCAIGRNGACTADAKREGDGATPLGRWPVRGALLRPDRLTNGDMPAIPWRWLRPGDGWSDGVADPAYNRPVKLPNPFSAEDLWRADQAYDVIIILGHNDRPPVAGMGSAIFFHQWVIGADGAPKPTEGCVAIAPDAMRHVLQLIQPGAFMDIA